MAIAARPLTLLPGDSPLLSASATALPRPTIVVIDDIPDLVDSVVMLLEMSGYDAFGETAGANGIRKSTEVGADLVVLDFLLPEMNGAEIGTALRAEPSLAALKILMLSATPEAMVRHSFTAYDGFLAKPVFAEDLLAAIDKLIGSGTTSPRLPS